MGNWWKYCFTYQRLIHLLRSPKHKNYRFWKTYVNLFERGHSSISFLQTDKTQHQYLKDLNIGWEGKGKNKLEILHQRYGLKQIQCERNVIQGQDPAPGVVELHKTGLGTLVQPVQIPLHSLPTLQSSTPTTNLVSPSLLSSLTACWTSNLQFWSFDC